MPSSFNRAGMRRGHFIIDESQNKHCDLIGPWKDCLGPIRGQRWNKGLHFTFTFMHLADAFIQSDLHCIPVTVSTFLSALAFPGNRTHDLGVANAMLYQLSYRKGLGSSFQPTWQHHTQTCLMSRNRSQWLWRVSMTPLAPARCQNYIISRVLRQSNNCNWD